MELETRYAFLTRILVKSRNPSNFLAVSPFAFFPHSICITIPTSTMLLSIFPQALVLPAISPVHNSIALLFIIDILPDIPSMIRPKELTFSIHLIRSPVTFVGSTISPFITTFAFNEIVNKIPRINWPVRPCKFTSPVFSSLIVAAFVAWSISPFFDSETMLDVFVPFASVRGSILMKVDSSTMGFIIEPLPFIYISVCVN